MSSTEIAYPRNRACPQHNGFTEIPKPCRKRERLLGLVLTTLKAHNDAAQAMIGRLGTALRLARRKAADAQTKYRDCREALVAHERSHRCASPDIDIADRRRRS